MQKNELTYSEFIYGTKSLIISFFYQEKTPAFGVFLTNLTFNAKQVTFQ